VKTLNRTAKTPAMVALMFVFLPGIVCFAKNTAPQVERIEGFRELKWGVSVEQGSNIYKDLYFDQYVLADSKDEPSKVYFRKDEYGVIDNVSFDSIEYWFRRDHFHRIRATLHSRFGPRTLVTRAEASWEKMVEYLRRKYGEPKEHRTDYAAENLAVVKEMRWEEGDVFLRLIYKGPARTNEDQLIFEMGK
jgi:hypothetical protein